jgi:riboflavin kinase/FMN adenylyltransferase
MKVLSSLEHHSISSLTIGNFDALHLGHQTLIQKMKGKKAVVTFSNHPSTILSKTAKLNLLTLDHKLLLFKELGVDLVFCLPFTLELAALSAEAFLKQLKECLNFSDLVLGHDARLGHKREGDQKRVQAIGEKLGFKSHYLPALLHNGIPISSTRIRAAVSQGNFKEAETLLGRSYSIFGKTKKGVLSVKGLCLPPFGMYPYVRNGVVGKVKIDNPDVIQVDLKEDGHIIISHDVVESFKA